MRANRCRTDSNVVPARRRRLGLGGEDGRRPGVERRAEPQLPEQPGVVAGLLPQRARADADARVGEQRERREHRVVQHACVLALLRLELARQPLRLVGAARPRRCGRPRRAIARSIQAPSSGAAPPSRRPSRPRRRAGRARPRRSRSSRAPIRRGPRRAAVRGAAPTSGDRDRRRDARRRRSPSPWCVAASTHGRRAEHDDGGDRAGDHRRTRAGARRGRCAARRGRATSSGEHAATASSTGRDRSGDQQADEGARGADEPGDAREASQEPVAFLVDALHATPSQGQAPRGTGAVIRTVAESARAARVPRSIPAPRGRQASSRRAQRVADDGVLDEERVVAELRVHDAPDARRHDVAGRCCGDLDLAVDREEPVAVDAEHEASSRVTPRERRRDAAAVAADVVRVHRLDEHDVAVRVEPAGELVAVEVEVATRPRTGRRRRAG